MKRLSTIDRMELILSQDRKLNGNISATLFVALNFCLVFRNSLTKAAWQKSGKPEPSAKLCYFGCIRSPEINPKLQRDSCVHAAASLNSVHPKAQDEPGLAELLQPWLERQYCAKNMMCLVLLTLYIHLVPLQPSGAISE